jgi:hypothetical protein
VDASDLCGRLRRHFEALGRDDIDTSAIYAEDAVLEFVHTGEQIRGKANIAASRGAYVGAPVSFEVHHTACIDNLGVVEMTMRFAGNEPHPVVAILELRGGQVSVERRYIVEPCAPPAYRAQWVETIAEDQ